MVTMRRRVDLGLLGVMGLAAMVAPYLCMSVEAVVGREQWCFWGRSRAVKQGVGVKQGIGSRE